MRSYMSIEGSLEVKLPTIWTDEKAKVGRVREEKRKQEKRKRRERVRRNKIKVREKVEKSRNTALFHCFCGSGRKVGCGAIWSAERWKNCTPLWRVADLEVKTFKTPRVRNTFGSWDVQKNARRWREDARSTFRSQSGKKHHMFGPLLEVEMMKKCTALWREAHFQVKMFKTMQVRSTLERWDVEKVHSVVARSMFPSKNGKSTSAPEHFCKLRCWKSVCRCGWKHMSKLEAGGVWRKLAG